eukprot:1196389-Prorocentrum_minimum.AAC.2
MFVTFRAGGRRRWKRSMRGWRRRWRRARAANRSSPASSRWALRSNRIEDPTALAPPRARHAARERTARAESMPSAKI